MGWGPVIGFPWEHGWVSLGRQEFDTFKEQFDVLRKEQLQMMEVTCKTEETARSP